MDIRPALDCIATQKRDGNYNGALIGLARESFHSYNRGDILLYTSEENGTFIVECPTSPSSRCGDKRMKKSLQITIKPATRVPLKFIEPIELGDLL